LQFRDLPLSDEIYLYLSWSMNECPRYCFKGYIRADREKNIRKRTWRPSEHHL